MAIIKTDPNQTKTAVALIGILVLVVGVTVVRINPGQQATSAAAPKSTAAANAPVKIKEDAEYVPTRNPFERPASLAAAPGMTDMSLPRDKRNEMPMHRWRGGDDSRIAPMPIGQGLEAVAPAKSTAAPANGSTETKPKPEFTLLATIKNENGFSAVIRSGESNARVVETGDILEGGYKVIKLEAGRAVLTDGRDKIVAKRPQT